MRKPHIQSTLTNKAKNFQNQTTSWDHQQLQLTHSLYTKFPDHVPKRKSDDFCVVLLAANQCELLMIFCNASRLVYQIPWIVRRNWDIL